MGKDLVVTYYLFDTKNNVRYSACATSQRDLIEKALKAKVSFRNACLRQADLTKLDLQGCDFTGADLSGCRVRGANLTNTKGFLTNKTAKLIWAQEPFSHS